MAVLRDRHTSGCADQVFIIARGGLDVCDGVHRSFVMKKGQSLDGVAGILPGVRAKPERLTRREGTL